MTVDYDVATDGGRILAERGETRPDQLNLRLSRSYSDILEAVSFVDENKPAAILRRVVEEYLDDRLADDDVQTLLKVRTARRARQRSRSSAETGARAD